MNTFCSIAQQERAKRMQIHELSSPTGLLPITVAIPVRNEEANLARCLERLSRFAEIVVIDSGSTDRTCEIAKAAGVRIIDFKWDGRYPKKRNWFLINSPPTQPWVLFLDADEFVNDAFCSALAHAVENDERDGYWLRYTNYFLDRPLSHGLMQRKLALFRTGKGLYEKIEEEGWSPLDMEIHEHPIIEGVVGEISTPIDHHDYKGLGKFIEKHRDYAMWEARRRIKLEADWAAWVNFTPRQRFKYRHITKAWYPWFYFVYAYFFKMGLLDGSLGFYYAAYKAWYFETIRLMILENGRLDTDFVFINAQPENPIMTQP